MESLDQIVCVFIYFENVWVFVYFTFDYFAFLIFRPMINSAELNWTKNEDS